MSSLIPIALRAGMQSSSIMSIADVCTQTLVEGKYLTGTTKTTVATSDVAVVDLRRTGRWAVAGLALHGPYFFLGMRRVDAHFGPATSLIVVAKKTAVAQFVLFPPYLVALFSLMGLLEGSPNIPHKVQQRVPEAFASGCIYWPLANGINFAVVPSTLRVPYLAFTAGIWNSYLSWTNARATGTRKQIEG